MIKERNIAVSIILVFVTCGIYSAYWFICLTNETNAAAEQEGTSGVTAFILTLITCGIYGFYWAYKSGEKIDVAKQKRGITSSNSGVHYLIVSLLGVLIICALIQNELNKLAK